MPRPLTATISDRRRQPLARVFVVDDDAIIRRLIVSMLESVGHEVRAFSRAGDLLAALDEEAADAVVVDVMMPDMDGLELLGYLRDREQELSVVVVSAVKGVDTIVEAIRLGASDFLAKPVRRERLLGAVRQAVEWTRLKRRVDDLETRLRRMGRHEPRPRLAPTPIPHPPERRSPSIPDLQTLEQQAIERALRHTGGNVSEAARRLGIGRTTLYRKMAAYGLAPTG